MQSSKGSRHVQHATFMGALVVGVYSLFMGRFVLTGLSLFTGYLAEASAVPVVPTTVSIIGALLYSSPIAIRWN